ncbi:hypothetical protein [Streptomyces sp. NPDC051183]|uniref:hypothetical protein n=1 Tax=Streptomyces sp. NPDC051183 TaxID=3155165 RepID=UPI0034381AC4
MFCWPAVVGGLLARPLWLAGVWLAVLLCPAGLGVRELYAVRRVRRALSSQPGPGWAAYDAEIVRSRGPRAGASVAPQLPLPLPRILLPDGRVLRPGLAWRPPVGPVSLWLGPGGAVWIPTARRRLGTARAR